MPTLDSSEIARVFRDEYARSVAVLVRHFGDIDLAEEAVQDAFTVAVQRWPAPASRRAPSDGSSRRPATALSIDAGANRRGRSATRRLRCSTEQRSESDDTRAPCTTTGCA